MTTQDIEARIAAIAERVRDRDNESAHALEDELYVAFIRHVAQTTSPPLSDMARRVLDVHAMRFSRWYA